MKRLITICLMTLGGLIAAKAANEADKTIAYELPMYAVDSIEEGRAYPEQGSNRQGSLIGFKGNIRASKRLPFTVGPGPVRCYIQVMPEEDRRFSVMLGDQQQSVLVPKSAPRYSHHEMVFDLPEATDRAVFVAEAVDDKQTRIIWYTTWITNDPEVTHMPVGPGQGKDSTERKYQLKLRQHAAVNPPGNLVPNSGFEAGLRGWDVQDYRSGKRVQPSLLSQDLERGGYSMNVAPLTVTSRPFTLAPDKTYTLALNTNADNQTEVVTTLEASSPQTGQFGAFKTFSIGQAMTSEDGVWKRLAFSFKTPSAGETRDNAYRLAIGTTEETTSPCLVDDIQIVEGENVPYAPHLGLEANFIPPNAQAIFMIDQDGVVTFNLRQAPDASIQAIDYVVLDYFDQIVKAKTSIPIGEGEHWSRSVKLDTAKAGFFRIRTTIRYMWLGEPQVNVVECFYNVLRPTPPRTDRRERSLIGAYFTIAPEPTSGYGEVASKFGFYEFNTLGHQMMRWRRNLASDSTPDDVRYDWAWSDSEVNRFLEAGIKPTVTLHVSNSSYAPPDIFDGKELPQNEVYRFRKDYAISSFSQAAWLDYVTRFARHFKGRIAKYVVQDEPTQYFTPDEYARFYLDTRTAIKAVDSDTPIYFDVYVASIELVDALNKLTDGQAHEHLDGVHCYLDQNHSSRVSQEAHVTFRHWLRGHDIPLVTATCYSPAYALDDTSGTEDFNGYGQARANEIRSLHHLIDAVVWGASDCHYYYYGVHPGRNTGIYLFDSYGRVKPIFHFFSAANHFLGGHLGTVSIDDFEPFRIGVSSFEDGSATAVLYAADGNVHDVTFDARGVTTVLDALGNPLAGWKRDGLAALPVAGYPVYIRFETPERAMASLQALTFSEDIEFYRSVALGASGQLNELIVLETDQPLRAVCTIRDPISFYSTLHLPAHHLGGYRHVIRKPSGDSPAVSIQRMDRIEVDTTFGPLWWFESLAYAPIRTIARDSDEGDALSWPPRHEGWLTLHETIVNKYGKPQRIPQGKVCFQLSNDTLFGTFEAHNEDSNGWVVSVQMIPVDPKNQNLQADLETLFVIDSSANQVPGSTSSKIRQTVRPQAMASEVTFAAPLQRIPHFDVSPGTVYAVQVTASRPNGGNVTLSKSEAPRTWARMMVTND